MSEPIPDPFDTVRALAARTGGFAIDLPHHLLVHLPGGHDRLMVGFDNIASRRAEGDRMPWAFDLVSPRGWDVLGVLVKRPDWFQDNDLSDALIGLRDEGFFARYGHVSMYGASMGGFGALAFAPLAPGCTVLAMAPQSTLDRTRAPFETRYRYARRITTWDGPFADAAEGVDAAGRAYVLWDPHEPLDTAHVDRLGSGANICHLRVPDVGHKIPPAFKKMRILKPVALAGLEGTLEAREFRRLFRARRNSVPWISNLLARADTRGHHALALKAAEAALATRRNWKLRHEVQARRQAARGGAAAAE